MRNWTIILMINLNCILFATNTLVQTNPYQRVIGHFKEAQIVFLGERHWSKQDSNFRISLLKQHNLPSMIDDVMIEFGNSLYQKILDEYFLKLKDIPDAELSKVWRNTTQTNGVWDSPVYEEFLHKLRKLNESLVKRNRIRVVALGPPIDWEKVEVYEDQLPFFQRGWTFIRIIEREVIAKDRKALVIIGRGHIMRRDNDMEEENNVIRRLESLYPKKCFKVVVPAYRLNSHSPKLFDKINVKDFPFYIESDSKYLNTLEAENYLPGSIGLLKDVVDGLIFWGEAKDVDIGPEGHFYKLNPNYKKELERRNGLKMRLKQNSYD